MAADKLLSRLSTGEVKALASWTDIRDILLDESPMRDGRVQSLDDDFIYQSELHLSRMLTSSVVFESQQKFGQSS